MKHVVLCLAAPVSILVASLALALPSPAFAGGDSAGGRPEGARTLREACRDDLARLCNGIRPGGGRLLACLRDHAADLSSRCHRALADAGALQGGAPRGDDPAR